MPPCANVWPASPPAIGWARRTRARPRWGHWSAPVTETTCIGTWTWDGRTAAPSLRAASCRTVRCNAGAYYPATLIEGLANSSRLAQEEIFGPIAVLIPFRGEEELVGLANDSDFGLAAGIWTGDAARAWRVARALQAGTVWINTYRHLSISTPFGGFKQSGLGREKGLQGMRAYMSAKGVYWGLG